jgi:hypothetical protein
MKKRKMFRIFAFCSIIIFATGLFFLSLPSIEYGDREVDETCIFVDNTMQASLFRFRVGQGRYPTTEEGYNR